MSLVVNRYVSALINSVDDNGSLKTVLEATSATLQEWAGHDQLMAFFKNPLISREEKSRVINSLTGHTLPVEAKNFLLLLANKRRLALVPQIATCAHHALLQLTNIEIISIATAAPLSDSAKTQLLAYVQTHHDGTIEPQFSVDESLLGGFRVRFGNKIIDASIAHHLDTLQAQFKA